MLELSYIGLSVLMSLVILWTYRNALNKHLENAAIRNRRMGILFTFFIFWFGYLFFLSKQEILFNLDFPPKIPLLILLPLVVTTIVFYFRNRNDVVLLGIPISYPIYYQTFRILVETLLLYTFYKNIIPKEATLEGLNFDVVMGISAPIMAYFIFKNENKYVLLAKIWNMIGILMVAFVAFIIATGFYQPQIWGSDEPIVSMTFVKLPYLLIPGFLAPSAIFMHIVSLIQLRHK